MDNAEYRKILEGLRDHHGNLRDSYLEVQAKGLSFEWDTGDTIQQRIEREDFAVRNLQAALNKLPG